VDCQQAFLFDMALRELKGHKDYFINDNGAVYLLDDKMPLKIKPIKRSDSIVVILKDNKKYDLLKLVFDNFYPDLILDKAHTKYSVCRRGFIIPSSVTVKNIPLVRTLDDRQSQLFSSFKCRQRAESANFRGDGYISGYDVFNALERDDFKCHYCKDTLVYNDWHLDHFYSLFMGGKNTKTNIVASCSLCNTMKNRLDGFAFVQRCKVIALKNQDILNQSESELLKLKAGRYRGINGTVQALKKQIQHYINYSPKNNKQP
jgi:hypothetical protein